MSNQLNYKESLKSALSDRYSISRFVSSPTEQLILETVPAEFGQYENEIIELVLYNPVDGEYVDSQTIQLSDDIIKVQYVQYENDFVNYIILDFNKLNELYPNFLKVGTFDLVINVFENMVGANDDKTLLIEKISRNRREVKLRFIGLVDDDKRKQIQNVVLKSIPKPFLTNLTTLLLKLDANDGTGVTTPDILLEVKDIDQIMFNVIDNLGLSDAIATFITSLFEEAKINVVNKLTTSDQYRYTEEEFQTLVFEEIVNLFEQKKTEFSNNNNVELI
jgi:hypothetical protein